MQRFVAIGWHCDGCQSFWSQGGRTRTKRPVVLDRDSDDVYNAEIAAMIEAKKREALSL